MGPYQVLSKNGMNNTIRSNAGKDMVVHHNNIKQCVVPSGTGTPYCSVRKG